MGAGIIGVQSIEEVTDMKRILLLLTLGVVGLWSMGCATKAQTGAAVGTGAGAATGAVIGHQSGHRTEGALIGGVVGAAGGYIVGNEMDKSDQRKQQSQPSDQSTPWKDQPQQQQAAITHTVNITNSNGSVTPVVLTKQGDMWVGPRGEHYATLPTEEQLKPVYGF